MSAAADSLSLLDWKRRVFALYTAVRAERDPLRAWEKWRATRDDLFRTHLQSPLPAAGRAAFSGLEYFPYDPELRLVGAVLPAEPRRLAILASSGQPVDFDRVAIVRFELGGESLALDVYWLCAYGGGVFVPFADATTGSETYGGGRYLLDTVKGADLGGDEEHLVLDFNFAYNPSCAYDIRWSCPLAPPGNRLPVAVRAGERQG